MDWLWARVAAAILWPIHALAKKLLYSKFQSAIGISKVYQSFKSLYLVVSLRGYICYLRTPLSCSSFAVEILNRKLRWFGFLKLVPFALYLVSVVENSLNKLQLFGLQYLLKFLPV